MNYSQEAEDAITRNTPPIAWRGAVVYCEMCLLDFSTASKATTTRENAQGKTVDLCETCARVEFDGLPPNKPKKA